ncbi:oxidoreductase, FAD/FMN dependent domain protein [Leptospira interrogans serovar Zanoni str. LT2156]|uniref:Oxidoreductase, FAD/FMN dependent domain protein n=1 Tax=Leptospira interrogans serovar Zanoni str. LT2156 TaxID=1001601 RepID=M6HHX6_LEPIR|nr:oxidoreductase, FAD/FMN dependent domain protein [Leptospira interrogans serovar Zanoni str. LT2156]
MKYSEIFQPIQIGSIVLPNRVIMGSMHLGLEGMPMTADRMIAFSYVSCVKPSRYFFT